MHAPKVSLKVRFVPAVALAGLILNASAHGFVTAYDFVTIDPPEGLFTALTGVNGSGTAVGNTQNVDESTNNFRYDLRTGESTPLPAELGGLPFTPIGINDSGTIVGPIGDPEISQAAILRKNGRYTTFAIPGFASIVPRGVGRSGLVSGYAIVGPDDWSGFLHDPNTGRTELFLTGSQQVIPQGIDVGGRLVGSVALPADGAYPGSPAGQYGFVREPDTTITLFRVNGLATRARGISDTGIVTGFAGSPSVGYTVVAPTGGGYRDLTVPEESLFAVPGTVATFPLGIDKRGRIVGSWFGADNIQRGFVATPASSQ